MKVRSVLVLSVVTTAIVAGSALPAVADDAPPVTAHSGLAAIQAAGANATSRRITSLNAAIPRVTSNSHLSSDDKSAVLAVLNGDLGGMNDLHAKIAADTTVATAWADYQSVFTGYRVYAVAIPQAFVAAGADGATGTAIPKLQSAATKLQSALDAEPTKATDQLKADLADMQAKTADAATQAGGLAAAALAVTPSAYNGNSAVMSDLRARLRTAIADLKTASQDGRAVLAGLK